MDQVDAALVNGSPVLLTVLLTLLTYKLNKVPLLTATKGTWCPSSGAWQARRGWINPDRFTLLLLLFTHILLLLKLVAVV